MNPCSRWMALMVIPALIVTACSPSPQQAGDAVSPQVAEQPAPAPASDPSGPGASEVLPTLEGFHWRLADAHGADLELLFRTGAPLQLDFNEGRIGVANLCNAMGASYQLSGGGALDVGAVISTQMACSDEQLMAAERRVAELLPTLESLELMGGDPPSLRLDAAGDIRLLFQGSPTPATRFGGPGERVFLEVAPALVSCHHPLMADAQCLHVRERFFNEAGLRDGEPGEWQVLPVLIEGYEHTAGVRNVLRVQRYHLADVPADAAAVAYVLDMVVESETVGM